MFKKLYIIALATCIGGVGANNLNANQQQIIEEKVLEEFAKIIFSNAMEAKRAFQASQVRELPIENFATTAPRAEFIANADISEELAAGVESATMYVSTDNQSTWQSSAANLLGTEGYETTWESTISTSDGSSSYSYLSGMVNSEVLGESYGTIIVSGSPHNINGIWPPESNLYATLANDASGDASSNYDITSVRGTYKGSNEVDGDGNAYTDVERFYLSLSLSGGCCDEGGLFGPWYLYGVGIVNPESEEAVAYAIGYGDGGFGELSPGLLKISGDLESGEIDGFEYITTNISYSTAGNNMQATALMSYITNDSQWGTWPNSYNGFIVLGVTVEAALDGLDVAAEIKDQTDPGLFVCTTVHQDGNTPLVLSAPGFDEGSNTLTVGYSDADSNLPWFKSTQICESETDNCFINVDMIPDSHDYGSGVVFSGSFEPVDLGGEPLSGDYDAKFWFADDDIENYPAAQIVMNINIGSGGCGLLGDSNGDGGLNVLDVVLLVNLILSGSEYGACSDVNGDDSLNVLDVVLLVNIILGGAN
jgi:uncharacterized protein (DUF779 family)